MRSHPPPLGSIPLGAVRPEMTRYACYPQPDQFQRSVGAKAYQTALQDSNRLPIPADLALHVSLPASWQSLQTEMALVAGHLDNDRRVQTLSLHCDQSPLPPALHSSLHEHFDLTAVQSITLACALSADTLPHLAQLQRFGISHLSLTTACHTQALLEAALTIAKSQGIAHIHLNVALGLPNQDAATCAASFEVILNQSPDSLTLLSGGHLPDWPDAETLRQKCVQKALSSGYAQLGLGHFARTGSPLATARSEGRLQHSLLGYRIGETALDQIGLGPGALSVVGDCLVENHLRPLLWEQALAKGRLPIRRGLLRDLDNRLRASVIERLLSDAQVSFRHFERLFDFSFTHYFAHALLTLKHLNQDQARPPISIEPDHLRVDLTALDWLPTIASAFDRYRQPALALSHIG